MEARRSSRSSGDISVGGVDLTVELFLDCCSGVVGSWPNWGPDRTGGGKTVALPPSQIFRQ